jgi:hypothetical protein
MTGSSFEGHLYICTGRALAIEINISAPDKPPVMTMKALTEKIKTEADTDLDNYGIRSISSFRIVIDAFRGIEGTVRVIGRVADGVILEIPVDAFRYGQEGGEAEGMDTVSAENEDVDEDEDDGDDDAEDIWKDCDGEPDKPTTTPRKALKADKVMAYCLRTLEALNSNGEPEVYVDMNPATGQSVNGPMFTECIKLH